MKENPKRLLCLKNCEVRKCIFFLTTLQHSLTYSLSPHCLFAAFIFDKTFYFLYRVREDPNSLTPPPFGHCPNSDWTPPRTQPGTLGHFFRAIFYHSAGLYASENGKCPKPSGQAFRPPFPQMGNAQMEGASTY